MEQETQQAETENKKPKTYVSFGHALLTMVAFVVLGYFGPAFLIFIISFTNGEEVIFGMPFSLLYYLFSIFIVIELVLFLFCAFRRPRLYVRTGIINIFYIVTVLLITTVFVLPLLSLNTSGGIRVFIYVVPLIVGATTAVYLNNKFQKYEIELGITQS